MKVLVATNNPGKVNEYNRLFAKYNSTCFCYKDLGLNVDPSETGKTFKENSKIKALEATNHYNGIIIADDSGLDIKKLPDILGVNSARFMDGLPYSDKCKEIIKRLEGINNRKAKFTTVITLVINGKIKQFKGVLHGTIAKSPSGTNGFGYDPIFIPKGYNDTFASLGVDVKNMVSHRAKALVKVERYLKKHENIISK